MKKLQETVAQSLASFDERVVKLFHQKIKTEMAINQVRLRNYTYIYIYKFTNLCSDMKSADATKFSLK